MRIGTGLYGHPLSCADFYALSIYEGFCVYRSFLSCSYVLLMFVYAMTIFTYIHLDLFVYDWCLGTCALNVCILVVVGPANARSVACRLSPVCQLPVPHSLVAACSIAGYRTVVSVRSVADCSNSAHRKWLQGLSIPDFLKGHRE